MHNLKKIIYLSKQILVENTFKLKTLISRSDTKIMIGRFEARLPKSHRLPVLRKLYPAYDLYFVPFFVELGTSFSSGTLIDVGANIGDTTLEVLSAASGFNSIAVEGSEVFLKYLELNTEDIRDRVLIVRDFLYSPRIETFRYRNSSTTGGFKELIAGADPIERTVVDLKGFVEVDSLLEMADGEVVVWKSDTDGLDIPILLENFRKITANTDVIWVEIHPHLPPTSISDIKTFSDKLVESEFEGVLFDNFGCVVGYGEGTILGKLVLSSCQQIKMKPQRLQTSPYYFDLIAFKSSFGDAELRERLIDALLCRNKARSN